MHTKHRVAWIYGVVLLVLLSSLIEPSRAEPLDTATIQVIVQIPMIVTLDTDTNQLVFEQRDFDFLTTSNASLDENGIVVTKPAALTLTARGNVGYTVTVSVESDVLVSSEGYQLLASQLRWRRSGVDEEWHEFSTQDKQVFVRMDPGESITDVDFQLLATWDNPAATYEGTIIYTIIAHGYERENGGV